MKAKISRNRVIKEFFLPIAFYLWRQENDLIKFTHKKAPLVAGL
jgi:hypothetical protein